MMNTSSKFGISTKQSLIAFVIMIVLILAASGFADQNGLAQAGIPDGYDYALAAPPGVAPTASPIPLVVDTASQSINSSSPEISLPVSTQTTAVVSAELSSLIASDGQSNGDEKSLSSALSDLISMATEKLSSQSTTTYTVYAPSVIQAIPPTPTEDPRFIFTPQDARITSDEGRSWGDYPGPSIWPDLEVPSPTGILAHPEDQVNILLLGSDQRENDSGFRTDTIQLLTINPSEGTVKLTAFPRDLYVYIPGYTMQRINTAFGWGGFDALADTMEYNFGVRPEYYVLINFRPFMDVIDSIGGITVDIGKDMCDHRDNWEGDFCVSQGTMWMSGESALWYVRSRYSTSDLDRGRRQQEVLVAAFKQMITINSLTRAPELYAFYKENVSTNVGFDLIARFIPLAAHLSKSPEIDNHSIGAGQVYNWINYSGAMVLVPIREPVMEVMREVITEP